MEGERHWQVVHKGREVRMLISPFLPGSRSRSFFIFYFFSFALCPENHKKWRGPGFLE